MVPIIKLPAEDHFAGPPPKHFEFNFFLNSHVNVGIKLILKTFPATRTRIKIFNVGYDDGQKQN